MGRKNTFLGYEKNKLCWYISVRESGEFWHLNASVKRTSDKYTDQPLNSIRNLDDELELTSQGDNEVPKLYAIRLNVQTNSPRRMIELGKLASKMQKVEMAMDGWFHTNFVDTLETLTRLTGIDTIAFKTSNRGSCYDENTFEFGTFDQMKEKIEQYTQLNREQRRELRK